MLSLTKDALTKSQLMHIVMFKSQPDVFMKYMKQRMFNGDFAKETEMAYATTMEVSLARSLSEYLMYCPPENYKGNEVILDPNRRFKSEKCKLLSCTPVIYEPAIGDIVTLPAYLLAEVAKYDKRLSYPNNWNMKVTKVYPSKACRYQWTNSDVKYPLIEQESVNIQGIEIETSPIDGGQAFTFPEVLINHYIILKSNRKEEL